MSFPASGRGHDGRRNDAPSKSTSPGGSVPPNGPPGGPNGSPDPTDDIVNRLTLLFLVILRFMISLLLAFAYAVATVANTGLYPDRGVTDSDSDGHPPDGPPGDPGGPRAGTSQTAGVPQSADSIGDCNAGTRWYCVFVGREVGIYNSWDEVVTHTTGVPGQSQRRYASQAEATRSFNLALASGRVRRIDTAVPATASTHNVPTRSVRFEPPSSSQTPVRQGFWAPAGIWKPFPAPRHALAYAKSERGVKPAYTNLGQLADTRLIKLFIYTKREGRGSVFALAVHTARAAGGRTGGVWDATQRVSGERGGRVRTATRRGRAVRRDARRAGKLWDTRRRVTSQTAPVRPPAVRRVGPSGPFTCRLLCAPARSLPAGHRAAFLHSLPTCHPRSSTVRDWQRQLAHAHKKAHLRRQHHFLTRHYPLALAHRAHGILVCGDPVLTGNERRLFGCSMRRASARMGSADAACGTRKDGSKRVRGRAGFAWVSAFASCCLAEPDAISDVWE
ncbi:hypothetical protein DFH11DRAFT_1546296 [Phellopilus nigrolimitatus]|nr:hypothetical protein DFH11DRAFT_1546296 [Phellopilus nigrolimitatus]